MFFRQALGLSTVLSHSGVDHGLWIRSEGTVDFNFFNYLSLFEIRLAVPGMCEFFIDNYS